MINSLYDKEKPYLSEFAKRYIEFLKSQGAKDEDFCLELTIKLFGEETVYELDE